MLYRTDIINDIIRNNGYKSYLEIGVGDPELNFKQIVCENKIGVDPYFNFLDVNIDNPDYNNIKTIDDCVKFRITSDEYFSQLSKDVKFDIIFIDGLHTEEQCDKDIQNSLLHISKNGLIVLHDTNPTSKDLLVRITDAPFQGDVYKSVAKLKNTGLKYFTYGGDCGITVIKPGVLDKTKYEENLELSYENFNENKDFYLNLVSEEDFLKLVKIQKTLLCCIVKQENLYLRDFVEYYKNIGFTNILLYDNNDLEGEYPQQVIGDYISEGFVIYVDVRGKYRYQLDAYTECYQIYCDIYDWIAFFDVDEFLEIKNGENVSEFLLQKMFLDTDAIYLYWLIYGDNGLLHYNQIPVYDRFTIPNKPDNEKNNYKIILRGIGSNKTYTFTDANSFIWHSGFGGLVVKNTEGKIITDKNPYESFTYNNAYIKHYNTLTIEEFLYRRFGRRSYADKASSFNKEVIMKIFYDVNELTSEKEKIINDFFDKFEFLENNV